LLPLAGPSPPFTYQEVNFTFSTAVTVATGEYAFVIVSTGPTGFAGRVEKTGTADNYPSGAYFYKGAGPWYEQAGEDLMFKIWGVS
jgi:hypothetical protein